MSGPLGGNEAGAMTSVECHLTPCMEVRGPGRRLEGVRWQVGDLGEMMGREAGIALGI